MIHEEIGRAVASSVATVIGSRARHIVPARTPPGMAGAPDFIDEPLGGAPSLNGNGVCPPGFQVAADACTGEIFCKKTKKRRKRLLTCGDKADIAFVIGTLGKGQIAQTAIASLLARCG